MRRIIEEELKRFTIPISIVKKNPRSWTGIADILDRAFDLLPIRARR